MPTARIFAPILFAAVLLARFPSASNAQEWKVPSPGELLHADEKRLVFVLSSFKEGRFIVALDPATGSELWRWKSPNDRLTGAAQPLGPDRLNFDQGVLDLSSGKFEESPARGSIRVSLDRLNCWDSVGIRAYQPDLTLVCDWKSTIGNPSSVGIAADAFYAAGQSERKTVLVKIGINGKLAWTAPEPDLGSESFSVQPTRAGVAVLLKTGVRVYSLDKGKPLKTWTFPKPMTSVEGVAASVRVVEDSAGSFVAWQWKEGSTTGTGKSEKKTSQVGLRLLDVERGWRKLRAVQGNIDWNADRFDFREGLVLVDSSEGPVLWNYAKDTEVALPATGFSRPGMASGAGLLAFVRLDIDKKQAVLQVRKLATGDGIQEWPVGTEKWATLAISEAGLSSEKAKAKPSVRRLKRGFMVCLGAGATGDSYYLPDGASAPVELGELVSAQVPSVEFDDRISVFVMSAGELSCRTRSFKR